MWNKTNNILAAATILILTVTQSALSQGEEESPGFQAKQGSEPQILVANGANRAVIIKPSQSTPTVDLAVQELVDHVKLATGVDLPVMSGSEVPSGMVAIHVGPTEFLKKEGLIREPLAPSENIIQTGDGWLALYGEDYNPPARTGRETVARMLEETDPMHSMYGNKRTFRAGTLRAVHRFLEEYLGVRWYMQGDLGTVVDSQGVFLIPPIDSVEKPRMQYLQFQPYRFNWRLQTQKAPDPDLKDWYARLGIGRNESSFFNHSFQLLTAEHRNDPKMEQIFALLPDGKRDFKTTSYGAGNLDLHHPDTVKAFVAMIRDIFKKYPELSEFSVAPADVWIPSFNKETLELLEPELRQQIQEQAGLVEVRGTARLSMSAELIDQFRKASGHQLAEFHVAVAWELYQSHPDKLIGGFAGYENYGNAESYLKLEALPPNLAFSFTKTRAMFWDRDYQKRVYEQARKFREITPHLHAWEYYLWTSRPWKQHPVLLGYPVFFPTILQEDADFWHEIGLKGEFNQNWDMGTRQPALDHLMLYLTAKVMSDPKQRVDQILDEYYPRFYGPAASEMRAFWELAETCWMRDLSAFDARTQASEIIEILYPREDLAKLFAHLDAALAHAPEDSSYHARIARIKKEMAAVKGRLQSDGVGRPQLNSAAIFPAPLIEPTFQDHWNAPKISLPEVEEGPGPGEIRVAHDPESLYMTFRFPMGQTRGALPAGLWYWLSADGFRYSPRGWANALLVELQPFPDKPEHFFSFLLSATGDAVGFEYQAFTDDPPVRKLAGEFDAAVGTNDDVWEGTLVIPWSTLGLSLRPGLEVRANFTSYQSGNGVTRWVTAPPHWEYRQFRDEGRSIFGSIFFPEN